MPTDKILNQQRDFQSQHPTFSPAEIPSHVPSRHNLKSRHAVSFQPRSLKVILIAHRNRVAPILAKTAIGHAYANW